MYLKSGIQQESVEFQDTQSDNENNLVYEYEEYKYFETIYKIQQELFKYTEEGCYPLCEYLSTEELDNYVNWIFEHCSS